MLTLPAIKFSNLETSRNFESLIIKNKSVKTVPLQSEKQVKNILKYED